MPLNWNPEKRQFSNMPEKTRGVIDQLFIAFCEVGNIPRTIPGERGEMNRDKNIPVEFGIIAGILATRPRQSQTKCLQHFACLCLVQ